MRTQEQIKENIITQVHNYRMCHRSDKPVNRERLFAYDRELTALKHAEADGKVKAAGVQ